MNDDRHTTKAGRAFLKAMQNDPEAQAGWERARRRLRAWAAVLDAIKPELQALEADRQAVFQEFTDAIRRDQKEMNDYLASEHLPTAKTIEEWEHLARIVESPVSPGDMTIGEIFEYARAWVDRQDILRKRAGTAGQKVANEGPETPDASPRKATVNAKMLNTMEKKPQSIGWTVAKWAEYLDCSPGAVHKTTAWTQIMESRETAKIARAMRDKAP